MSAPIDLRRYGALLTYEQQRAAAVGADADHPSPVPTHARATLGDLSARLADAEIADARSIGAPGAVVVLPWGVELTRALRASVADAFLPRGYELHEFPEIAPESVYAPAVAAFPDAQQFLYVADASELARGVARGVLAPTGESMVYQHWARHVRTSADLPLRLYRNARYFRPVPSGRGRSGRGVLRPLEAPDVHEFHAAFLDPDQAREEVANGVAMVDEVVRGWHVPVLWSMRPPWTNRGELYEAAFGADTLLPSGDTVQVGVVYDQGDGFSRAFDIRVRDTRPHRHPVHVTGCVTRRVLFAHIFQSGEPFTLHPLVAPVAVVVRGPDDGLNRVVAAAVSRHGARARVQTAAGREVQAVARRWTRRGVGVQVLVQGPRDAADPARVVITTSGRPDETVRGEFPGLADRAAGVVADALAHAVAGQSTRATRMWDTVRRVGAEGIAEVVADGGVAVVGLLATRDAVASLEAASPGEVLGLLPAAAAVRCVVTGYLVDTYALVGRRA